MNVGRPTDYRAEFCERVIELGKEGKSKAQMAARLGVCRMTLENWTQNHPEFMDAINRARELSQDWWEEKGQRSLDKPIFQTALWAKSMSARFQADYSDRSKVEIAGSLEITKATDDELDDELLQLTLIERARTAGLAAASAMTAPVSSDFDDLV